MQKPRHGLASEKASYSRWLYGRACMEKLRETLSWTEISRAVRGHGDAPGWANEAYQYPNMMADRDVDRLDELVSGPTEKDRGNRIVDARLTADGRRAYAALLRKLIDRHGWTKEQIAHALGYAGGSGVNEALKTGGGMLSRLTKLQSIVDLVEAEARTDDAKVALESGDVAPPPMPILNGDGGKKKEAPYVPPPAVEIPPAEVRLRVPEEEKKGPPETPEERLRDALGKASEALLEMAETAPPFMRKGIDEGLGQLSGLMEFFGV